MAGDADAEHVPELALVPVGGGPHAGHRVHTAARLSGSATLRRTSAFRAVGHEVVEDAERGVGLALAVHALALVDAAEVVEHRERLGGLASRGTPAPRRQRSAGHPAPSGCRRPWSARRTARPGSARAARRARPAAGLRLRRPPERPLVGWGGACPGRASPSLRGRASRLQVGPRSLVHGVVHHSSSGGRSLSVATTSSWRRSRIEMPPGLDDALVADHPAERPLLDRDLGLQEQQALHERGAAAAGSPGCRRLPAGTSPRPGRRCTRRTCRRSWRRSPCEMTQRGSIICWCRLHDHRRHLLEHGAGDDHHVGLARRDAQHLRAVAGDVVAGCEGGRHLDEAAAEAEAERPQGVLAAPGDEPLDARGDDRHVAPSRRHALDVEQRPSARAVRDGSGPRRGLIGRPCGCARGRRALRRIRRPAPARPA